MNALLKLCRSLPDFTETAHKPECYYTKRYILHEDILYSFMDSGPVKAAWIKEHREEWEDDHDIPNEELDLHPCELEYVFNCEFDFDTLYLDKKIIVEFY